MNTRISAVTAAASRSAAAAMERRMCAVSSQPGAFSAVNVRPAPVTAALRDLAQREGATLYMTLLAAFYVLVGRYTGESDVAVGTPIANRTRPELEHLIGFFVNTLVLRGDLSGDPTFRELLARTRDTALAAYAHQDLPFEQLVDHLQPERQLNRNPLTQISFQLLNVPAFDFELDGMTVEPFMRSITTTRFDLEVHIHEARDGRLVGRVVFATDVFESATIRDIAGDYIAVLTSVAGVRGD